MISRVLVGFITVSVKSHISSLDYSRKCCDIEIILNGKYPEFTFRKVNLYGSLREQQGLSNTASTSHGKVKD
jgi:hypothetical protein